MLRWAPALALLLVVGVVSPLPAAARAQPRMTTEERARRLRAEMRQRGDSQGDIDLALAWLFARANRPDATYFYVKQAREHGISAGRTDLLLGMFYRKQRRYDAAFSTLVRVLVAHEEQPFALVQLWKTLYEAKLQGAETRTDTDTIQQRLERLGLHFPRSFEPSKLSESRSRELSASAYNALLTGRTRFAAELFEAAIDAFPSNPLAHRGLGIARARREDYARAAGAYLLYLELKPHAPDAAEVDRVLMQYWKYRRP